MKERTPHNNGTTIAMVVLVIVFSFQAIQYLSNNSSISALRSLSRQKRLIFLTSERRLALPVGTVFSITPTLNLPLARNLPTGYGADMLISIPISVSFDDLQYTSEENPWGLWPDFTLFLRKRREASSPTPVVDWSGGERKVLYQVLENTLQNMGIDGAPCLLRAICEYFQSPLKNHGFFGEILELIFSASRSPDANVLLKEYTKAEKLGKTTGKCSLYHEHCSYSLFTSLSEEQMLNKTQERQKRFIYLTPERRLTLPPGTLFFLTPRLDIPGFRTLPLGFASGLGISIPILVSFDTLGLTTPDHPFGNWTILDTLFREKREVGDPETGINWSGGDREFMYRVIENTLSNLGMDGKACLLRATCEMFQSPLDRHGVLGEALELFFSASRSPYADIRMEEYVEAERKGRSSGDCLPYHKSCSHSLFVNTKHQSPHPMDIVY